MKQYALVVKQDEMSANIAEKIKKGLTGIMEYNPDDPDLVISVGGDGTMLLSVHQYMEQKVSFVGVHTGTLGFFTDYQKDEITELIAAIKADHYQMTPRHLLEVDVNHKAGKETYLALN